jgi:hypothetical protein
MTVGPAVLAAGEDGEQVAGRVGIDAENVRGPSPAAPITGSREPASRTPPAPLTRPGSARSLTRSARSHDQGSSYAGKAGTRPIRHARGQRKYCPSLEQ